jgi:AsmA protein
MERAAPFVRLMDERMRHRLKWAAIVFVTLLLAVAGAYRWPISSAYAARELGAQLSRSVGLEFAGGARVYLTILPQPKIYVVDLELRGRDGAPVITAPMAKLKLALAPLLIGRLQVSSAELFRPTVLVDLERRPFVKDSALARIVDSKSGSGAVGDETQLGALRFKRGLLHIVAAQNGLDTLIEDVDGELDWPQLAGPLRLDLHATWRSAPVTIEARLGEPAAWLAGGRSQAVFDLTSPAASLKMDGAFTSGAATGFQGALSVDVASVSALTKLFGGAYDGFAPEGRVALDGKAIADLHMVTLSDVRLDAFAQRFDGALALSRTPTGVSISGSLAADTLALDDFLDKAPSAVDARGEWSPEPLRLGAIGALALDLRGSVANVTWRGHTMQDAAFSLICRNGAATATLSQATVYKGLLKGEISLAPGAEGTEANATLSLANADIGALAADFGTSAFSGQGGGEISVHAVGDSPAALARALGGDASITLGPGIIEGVSFEEALRRSQRRPIVDLFADMRTGRTVFNEAAARATIEKGEAHLRSAAMIGPGVVVTMKGGADIGRREVATQFSATRADQHGAPDPMGPQINVTVAGPWSRPIIKSDAGA